MYNEKQKKKLEQQKQDKISNESDLELFMNVDEQKCVLQNNQIPMNQNQQHIFVQNCDQYVIKVNDNYGLLTRKQRMISHLKPIFVAKIESLK